MSWEGLVMTLNKSLFNFGIFKNTVYRFKWGSLLYLVALFFSVPFMLIVADFERLAERILGSSFYMPTSVILRQDYLIFPLLLAVVVPTIVAVLVFNNVHSSKQGIFTHGLPTDRGTIYISNLAAAFVLMAVPVIVNGIILMLMSFGKYGQIMTSVSVIYWTGLNLNMLFVMFSIAVFSAFLTGNAAAHIGINVFLHLVPIICGWAIYLISEQFLFGFYQAENFVGNELINNSPIVWIFGRSLNKAMIFANIQTWIYIIGAIAVYVLGYLLYKNRKIESCGDVAAFDVFKPILKYAVAVGAAIALFGILTSMSINAVAMFVVVLVLTAIAYFAAEMLINKSFKIFKTSYKGYLGFVAFCAVFIGFFAYTNVLGYETRIPKPEDVKSAWIQEGWRSDENFEDKQLIDNTIKIHKEIIADIPVVEDDETDFIYMVVSYKLKNDKTMRRRYRVTFDMYDKAMSEMYKSKEYKLRVTEVDNLNVEKIDSLVLRANCAEFSYNIALNADAPKVLQAIKKDIEELSYSQLERSGNALQIGVHFSCTVEENERLKYFKDTGYKVGSEEAKYAIHSFNLNINSNYKNAYAFLKENGYYDQILGQLGPSLVICKKPMYRAGELYTYKGDTGDFSAFLINPGDCADIEAADEGSLAEFLATNVRGEMPEGKNYIVFTNLRDIGGNLHSYSNAMIIKADELPDYLKKYVEQ